MLFNYSITQQIYTASEIGTAGTITSIAFEYTHTSPFSMSGVRVYMKNVDKSSFISGSDMVEIYNSDLVWTGDFSASEAGWITLTLDTPFPYDGTGNLLVCCYDTTAGYPGSSFKFRVSDAPDYLAIDYYSDNYIPDLSDVTSFSGSTVYRSCRNNIRLGITPGDLCPVPTGLATTDITSNSATLGWSDLDPSYNVRYRESATYTEAFSDDFENGLNQWTVYTEGETISDHTDGWFAYDPSSEELDFPAHSGSYCASAWSWMYSPCQADNWLVSPQVPLGGLLKFWVRTSTNFPDSYEVRLSTTGNDISSFTITLQAMSPAPNNDEWNEVTIDLGGYTGNGYIAIHHVGYDMIYLLIDDFSVSTITQPAGAWTTLHADSNSVTLSGLAAGTDYDFQVQGICEGQLTAWSSLCRFTTANEAPQDAVLTVSVDETLGSVLFNGQPIPNNTYNGLVGETVTLTASFVRDNGISGIDASGVSVFAREHGIIVRGAARQQVSVFDVLGRPVAHVHSAADEEYIPLTHPGLYLVKVGTLPADQILILE